MKLIDTKELKTLLSAERKPGISLYMPAHRSGFDTQQDPIRFKNLLNEARAVLENRGWKKREIDEILAPAQERLDDEPFWQHQKAGLAFFLSPGWYRFYRLPVSMPERVVVQDRLFIKPLLEILRNNQRFFILSLNVRDIALYEANPFGMRRVEDEAIPRTIEEVMQYEDPEKQVQFHTGTGRQFGKPSGKRPAIFHGHGGSDLDRKEVIERFFHQVDKGVAQAMKNEKAPLIPVGLDRLIPMYRKANHYPHLMENGVPVNPEGMGEDELREKAFELLRPAYENELEGDMQRFARAADSGKAQTDIETIVMGAYEGRVDTLFVLHGEPLWGEVDAESGRVFESPESRSGSDLDLLDFAASQTFFHGGKVYVLDPDDMPVRGSAAALFYDKGEQA